MIAAYVSGHGYGHAVRTGQVLRALRARRPDLRLAMVTSVDERVCRRVAGEPLTVRRAVLDVGVVQADAITLDERATADAWEALHRDYDERVAAEARWMREAGVEVVVADVPPIAFDAAATAGIPSVGVTNFSWDWIYRHLARREARLLPAAEQAAHAYGRAGLLLELPFAGDLSAFPRRERIPLVARRPPRGREEARRRFDLPADVPVVLLTFGGIGLPGLDLATLGGLREFVFVATEGGGAAPNVRRFDLAALDRGGLEYVELVSAADVVVTKPGYGIVTDAIACRTRVVYTERGDFPEYPVLVEGMSRWVPSAHVSNADLRAGRLRPAVQAVLAMPFPEPPSLDGATAAARAVVALAPD